MLFSSCSLSKSQKNECFFNTKNFFKKSAEDTTVEKIASIVFLIYSFIIDIANIAKISFMRKVTINNNSNNWKKYVGYTLIALLFLAIFRFKKHFAKMSFSSEANGAVQSLEESKEVLGGFTKKVSGFTLSALLTNNLKQTLNSTEKKLFSLTNVAPGRCENDKISDFFRFLTNYRNGFFFCGSALVIILALYNLRLKASNQKRINDASLKLEEGGINNSVPSATLVELFNSGDDSDSDSDSVVCLGPESSPASAANLASPLASAVLPNIGPHPLPNNNLLDPQPLPPSPILLTEENLEKIKNVVMQYEDFIFFWKSRITKNQHREWIGKAPIKYLDAKWQLSGGTVFPIENLPNLIFKLERPAIFKPNGKIWKKDEKKRAQDIESGILIDVNMRIENINKCKKIIEDEKLDSIILPKTLYFNYKLKNMDFPMLVQEKFNFERDEKGAQLTLYEALEKDMISDNSFMQFVRFLLISGFEDVRKDNILIVREKNQYKIALIDFDKLDRVETSIFGSKEKTHEYGQGGFKKIPGLLSPSVIPIENNKYIQMVKETIDDLKESSESVKNEKLNSTLIEIEAKIDQIQTSSSSVVAVEGDESSSVPAAIPAGPLASSV